SIAKTYGGSMIWAHRIGNIVLKITHLRSTSIDRAPRFCASITSAGGYCVRGRGILLSLPLLGSLVAAGGCALMPASGPASWDVWAGQHDPKNLPYAFVRITPKVADVLRKAVPRLTSEFQDRSRPKDIRFGVGDIVGVTLFEAS